MNARQQKRIMILVVYEVGILGSYFMLNALLKYSEISASAQDKIGNSFTYLLGAAQVVGVFGIFQSYKKSRVTSLIDEERELEESIENRATP